MTRRIAPFAAALAITLLPAFAQDEAAGETVDGKTFIETWLQDNLSAAGRAVEVTGFAGALTSQATMQRLTIADDDGVWLVLEDAQLDWTRSALLKGRLEIDALTAQRIEIVRPPVAVSDGPEAAASDFALPELPVSIDIGEISAAHVVLGESVLGVATEFALTGRGRLEGGAGEAVFTLERIDGAEGRYSLDAAYANETQVLALDLDFAEGPDGIVSTLAGLPAGAPLSFTIAGTGPIDAFTADLALATGGTERIGGQVVLSRPTAGAPLGFTADLAGDPSALLAPDYHAFFGDDVRLGLAGARAPDGRLDIARLDIATEALRLAGNAVVAPGGWPERLHLAGEIAAPGGGPVVLPVAGGETRADRAEIALDYDVAKGDDWQARLALTGLSRPDLSIASATLAGTGTITPGAGGILPGFAGRVTLAAGGLAGAPGSLAAALAPALNGRFDLARDSGGALDLTGMTIAGTDFRLTGDVTLDSDVTRLDLIAAGAVTLAADDLARFAALAGQDLTGAARLEIAGTAALPGGPFDVDITGRGRDLGAGIPELDRLFAGASTLTLSAARGAEGTRVDRFEISAPGASASATGWLAPTGSELGLRLDLPDAARLGGGLTGLTGPLAAEATALQEGDDWRIALDATGPGGARADLDAFATTNPKGIDTVTGEFNGAIDDLAAWSGVAGRELAGAGAGFTGGATYRLDTGAFAAHGVAEATDLAFDLGAADRLTAGRSRVDFAIERDAAGTLIVDKLALATPELTLDATGSASEGQPRLALKARLRDLAAFVPGLPGAFTLDGTAALTGPDWQLEATGAGPGGSEIRAAGTLTSDAARADLKLTGRAPLALANAAIAPRALSGMAVYDLTLAGPLALSALRGTIRAEAARATLPTYGIALDPLTGSVALEGGRARLDLAANVSTGGRITVAGPVALTAPYPGDLAIALAGVVLRDPSLYKATVDGTLRFAGPLAGGAGLSGQVRLGTADLRIPETGFGVDGSLDGLVHVGASRGVEATRARAGLTGTSTATGGTGPAYGLDVTVEAPGAVFIRGRGLDAELGGTIALSGSTAAVVTTGDIKLIRGRLDILGNRLALTEGKVTMQGDLDPAVNLVAETRAEEVTVRIAVDGPISDPTIAFTASPELPEDEILARLVFGRGLDQISAFQALKLASAVATLSGKGGAGTIGRLREGFGLDDLDVTTDETGGLAVSAGTYLSDNVYTDVTVGGDGRAEINLNLSLTPEITAKGSVGTDGSTGLGIYFEKDY